MCAKCGADADDGGGGICRTCAAIPAASTARAKTFFLDIGWDVASPARENAQYDLVVFDREAREWCGVQVKTVYGGTVNTCRPNATGREPYNIEEVKYFAIVHETKVYILPFDWVNNGGRMNIGTVQKRHHEYWAARGMPQFLRAGD
jgi:hypothetical protein